MSNNYNYYAAGMTFSAYAAASGELDVIYILTYILVSLNLIVSYF